MMLLALACAEPQETAEETDPTTTPLDVVVAAEPAEVDFGDLAWGEVGQQTLVLTNQGAGTISVSAASADNGDVDVEALLGVPIAPGATETVQLSWDPASTDDLDAAVEILVVDSTGPSATLSVPIAGEVAAAELEVSASSYDFGTVSVGCSESTTFVLTNDGDADLTIEAISVVDSPAEYSLSADGGELGLPWTLAAGTSRDVDLSFAPSDSSTLAAVLQVTSSDPASPTTSINLVGTGHIDGEDEVVYNVEIKNATVLIAVNAVAVFSRDWEDAIPVLFEELGASRADWRVAFLTEMTGEVVGENLYIDQDMDEDERNDIIDDMLENTGGDNDYLLQTLQVGIEENREWLLDEDDEWMESTLNLIGMNSDVEQSTGSYVTYVDAYRAYKEDPADVFVHAVAGEQPMGCNENGLFAEPSGALEFAATLTGGTFASWCNDWGENMEAIADAALSGIQRFELNYVPNPDTIEVKIDEISQTEGWTWDEEDNEILFDEEHFPDPGSEVKVHYLTEASCD